MTNEHPDEPNIGDPIVLQFAIALGEFIAGLEPEPRAYFARVLEHPTLTKIAPRGTQWLRNAIDGETSGEINLRYWSNGDVAQTSLMANTLFMMWGNHKAPEPPQLGYLLLTLFTREAALRLQERHDASYN